MLLITFVANDTQAKEMYKVASTDEKILTFYYDDLKNRREGTVFNIGDNIKEFAPIITKVVFDPSFVDARPTSTSYWFNAFNNLTQIIGIENLNTSEVTDMSGMFEYCKSLTTLDVSHFDTKQVENMSNMFYNCYALTSIDLRYFDVSSVDDMSKMFYNCSNLTTIYANKDWNMSDLNSENMFYACWALVGGTGTTFDTGHMDASYAHVDQAGNPGYFTFKEIPTEIHSLDLTDEETVNGPCYNLHTAASSS